MKSVFAPLLVVLAAYCVGYFNANAAKKLESSRDAIRVESTQSALRDPLISPKNRKLLNPVLSFSVPELKRAHSSSEGPFTDSGPQAKWFLDKTEQGAEIWCQPKKALLEPSQNKCNYPDACFQCDTSTVIIPEIETRPLCSDGSQAIPINIACCANPSGVCPDPGKCMDALSTEQCVAVPASE